MHTLKAIRFYLSEQKEILFYANFASGCKELKAALNISQGNTENSLDDLINDLENKQP